MDTRTTVGTLILMFVCGSFATAEHCPVVKTAQGLIAGKPKTLHSGRGIFSFLGIPYAEPPVGELRFRSPVRKKPWNGTLRAFEFGNECCQCVTDDIVIGHEDCLFLNVYAPQLKTSGKDLLPVMVYVHGGAFTVGSSNTLGPDYILDKDVILVTCNYRLGALGFLSTGDSFAPGNYALKDLTMVLNWVQENIRAFGGDPDSVTAAGQSAGGALVHYLTLSDKSKSLFHKYIIQSSSALHPWAFYHNSRYRKYAKQLAEEHDCPTESSKLLIDCLRKLNVKQLQSTVTMRSDKVSTLILLTWAPTNEPESEEAFLTKEPWDLIRENKGKDAPFILLFHQREMMYLLASLFVNEELFNIYHNDVDDVIKDVLSYYSTAELSKEDKLVEEIKNFYFHDETGYDKRSFIERTNALMTDLFFTFPTFQLLQSRLRDAIDPYYFVLFDYRGTFSHTSFSVRSNENLGTTHSDDLIYLFPFNARYFQLPKSVRMTEEDYEIVDIMVDLWTSFVIDGRPTSKNLKKPDMWTPYAINNNVLRIGNNSETTITLDYSFDSETIKFWQEQIRDLLYPTLNDGGAQ